MEMLKVNNLSMHFPIYGGVLRRQVGKIHAVNDVSFSVKKGETLGLVGESGCGKSTLGRTLLRLYKATSGSIIYNNLDINSIPYKQLKSIRKDMQIIFQDPFASLDPRMTVGDILSEPFRIHKIKLSDDRTEVRDLLSKVGMLPDAINRYPHEFSGGQRQRIGIARAIALNPQLIIADEPVSALDVSIQSQILNLLKDLQVKLKLTYIFIAHNLAVVKHMSDKIAVMYLGRIIEVGKADVLYRDAKHPYTKALITAIPTPDPEINKTKTVLEGDVPSPINPPKGCAFHPRCPIAEDICKKDIPRLINLNQEHSVACHLVADVADNGKNNNN